MKYNFLWILKRGGNYYQFTKKELREFKLTPEYKIVAVVNKDNPKQWRHLPYKIDLPAEVKNEAAKEFYAAE